MAKATGFRKVPLKHTITLTFTKNKSDQRLYRLLVNSANQAIRRPLHMQVRYLLMILFEIEPCSPALLHYTGLKRWGMPVDIRLKELERELGELQPPAPRPPRPSRLLRLVPASSPSEG